MRTLQRTFLAFWSVGFCSNIMAGGPHVAANQWSEYCNRVFPTKQPQLSADLEIARKNYMVEFAKFYPAFYSNPISTEPKSFLAIATNEFQRLKLDVDQQDKWISGHIKETEDAYRSELKNRNKANQIDVESEIASAKENPERCARPDVEQQRAQVLQNAQRGPRGTDPTNTGRIELARMLRRNRENKQLQGAPTKLEELTEGLVKAEESVRAAEKVISDFEEWYRMTVPIFQQQEMAYRSVRNWEEANKKKISPEENKKWEQAMEKASQWKEKTAAQRAEFKQALAQRREVMIQWIAEIEKIPSEVLQQEISRLPEFDHLEDLRIAYCRALNRPSANEAFKAQLAALERDYQALHDVPEFLSAVSICKSVCDDFASVSKSVRPSSKTVSTVELFSEIQQDHRPEAIACRTNPYVIALFNERYREPEIFAGLNCYDIPEARRKKTPCATDASRFLAGKENTTIHATPTDKGPSSTHSSGI